MYALERLIKIFKGAFGRLVGGGGGGGGSSVGRARDSW